jgi:hypothetical protein
MDVYYKRNTFSIYVGLNGNPTKGICYPRPATARLVRHLLISGNCDAGTTLEDLALAPDAGWRWLLKPLRPLHSGPLDIRQEPHPEYISSPPESNTNTLWQLSFSNLKTLEMTFFTDDAVGDRAGRSKCCNLGLARRNSLVGLVEDAKLLIKADSVQMRCWVWSSKEQNFCVEHEKVFEALERRATKI